MKSLSLFTAAVAVASSPVLSHGCDLCAAYSATHAQGLATAPWNLSVATQFTHFATLRDDGDRVPNPVGQRLDSTITQFVLSHGFTDRLSAQINIPVINRTFRRPEGGEIEEGHERGLGDVSLLGRFEVVRRDTAHTTLIWDVLGGVKFGTGSTTRIAEELEESHDGHAHEHDHGVASGVHGHDLTLGTGSTDAILGTTAYARYDRFFATAYVQYARRNRGDYGYRFANDLTWEAAPGAYLLLGHEHTLGLQLVASGERKANDDLVGEQTEDTGITSVYLGPRVTYTRGLWLSVGIGADFPVRMENTALQITPDYRLRGSLTWTF